MITSVYAGIAALLFVFLSLRVIKTRRSEQVALGDGENTLIRRAMRVHGNFAEYVPLALVILVLAEMQGAPMWLLHVIGLLLIGGRVAHAFGVAREPEDYRFRTAGMVATFFSLIIGGFTNLVLGGSALIVSLTGS